MARAIYTRSSGVIKKVLQLNTKVSGSIKKVTAVYTRVAGVIKKIYPEATTAVAYTSPGTTNVVVPPGCYSITYGVYGGAGGGGAGCSSFALFFSEGGGGGSGGKRESTVAVVPGETLTAVVGAKGSRGVDSLTLDVPGTVATDGASSSLTGSFGTLTATGGVKGGRGLAATWGAGGAGGTPSGDAGDDGQAAFWVIPAGGTNGSGYGNGGRGGSFDNVLIASTDGADGRVSITFTAAS